MKLIKVRNINAALAQGLTLLENEGEAAVKDGFAIWQAPCAVTTVYSHPHENVITYPRHNANPFFDFMYAIWTLNFRQNLSFLSEFKHEGECSPSGFSDPEDANWLRGRYQLQAAINELKDSVNADKSVYIWSYVDDITQYDITHKSLSEITSFKIKNERLQMTVHSGFAEVFNEAYGWGGLKNSVIQQYVAATLNISCGELTHIVNSYFIYQIDSLWKNEEHDASQTPGDKIHEMSHVIHMKDSDMNAFNHDLNLFFLIYESHGLKEIGDKPDWQSDYFKRLVIPTLCTFLLYKKYNPKVALDYTEYIKSDDWRLACENWLIDKLI